MKSTSFSIHMTASWQKVLAHHELHSSLVALLRLLLHRGEAHGEARPDMGEERRDVIL